MGECQKNPLSSKKGGGSRNEAQRRSRVSTQLEDPVARAATWAQRLVIMDEPTAALGVKETRQVLDLIRRVRGALPVLLIHEAWVSASPSSRPQSHTMAAAVAITCATQTERAQAMTKETPTRARRSSGRSPPSSSATRCWRGSARRHRGPARPVARVDGDRVGAARPARHLGLIGASSVGQLEDNVAALAQLEFSEDELDEIDAYAVDSGINLRAASSAV
jgi:hypothetical protein